MQIEKSSFQNIAESAGYGEVRTDYSGRSMYGDTCPAIVFDWTSVNLAELGVAILEEFVYWAEDDEKDEAIEKAKSMAKMARTDSMGFGTVVYFPDLDLI